MRCIVHVQQVYKKSKFLANDNISLCAFTFHVIPLLSIVGNFFLRVAVASASFCLVCFLPYCMFRFCFGQARCCCCSFWRKQIFALILLLKIATVLLKIWKMRVCSTSWVSQTYRHEKICRYLKSIT